jgi:hypothetical protein
MNARPVETRQHRGVIDFDTAIRAKGREQGIDRYDDARRLFRSLLAVAAATLAPRALGDRRQADTHSAPEGAANEMGENRHEREQGSGLTHCGSHRLWTKKRGSKPAYFMPRVGFSLISGVRRFAKDQEIQFWSQGDPAVTAGSWPGSWHLGSSNLTLLTPECESRFCAGTEGRAFCTLQSCRAQTCRCGNGTSAAIW